MLKIEKDEDSTTVYMGDQLVVSHVAEAKVLLDPLLAGAATLCINLQDMIHCDTAGFQFLYGVLQERQRLGLPVTFHPLSKYVLDVSLQIGISLVPVQ